MNDEYNIARLVRESERTRVTWDSEAPELSVRLLVGALLVAGVLAAWLYFFSLVAPVEYPMDCGTNEEWSEACDNYKTYHTEQ